MICASISKHFICFGQLVKEEESSFSIEVVGKKSLPFIFEPSKINDPQLHKELEKVFLEVRDDLPVPDRNLVVSIPSNWADLVTNKIDIGLPDKDVKEVLEWNTTKRLGNVAVNKFIQHYPLLQDSDSVFNNYLTVSYFKELGKILVKAAQSAGFSINTLDINIFSAANAIEKLSSVGKYNKWGVWLVGEERQILLLVDSGEFFQYLEFEFTDDLKFSVISNSSPDSPGEEVILELNAMKTLSNDRVDSLDYLFFYCHDVDSDFFNMLLTYEVENMGTVDPFSVYKPLNLYKDDGEGIGAMCQFLDVMGLMLRIMPGS